MLSRIAESLFWIGRYLERAEDTTRIVEVHLQLLLDDPTVDQDDAAMNLLEVMGVPVGAAISIPLCGLRDWPLNTRRKPKELERRPGTGAGSTMPAGEALLKVAMTCLRWALSFS